MFFKHTQARAHIRVCTHTHTHTHKARMHTPCTSYWLFL